MPRKPVIQNHHITYSPEWKVPVYKGEHWILSQMQRRRKLSRGFMAALHHFLDENESKAVEL